MWRRFALRAASPRRARAASVRMSFFRRDRFRAFACLLPRAAGLLILSLAAARARGQDTLTPLPPPVTRGLYRSHWFDYLSAFSENDRAAEDRALEDMVRAGRKVGVRRLSDFSRT